MFNYKLPVSLIITTYNDAEYLPKALDSVIKLNIRPAEVLIIDDGSESDEAIDVVNSYRKKCNDITFSKKKNGGPSSARNYGVYKSTQKYIAFLDADDQLLQDDIKDKYLSIFSLPENYFGVYGSYIDSRVDKLARYRNYDGVPSTSLIGRENGIPGCVFSYLFRRSHLLEVSGFDENLTHNEDFDLLIRLILRGYSCKGQIGAGVYRNYRPSSLTRNENHFKVYNAVSKFLDKAESHNFFDKVELAKRRKANGLALAKKLSNSRCSKKEVKKALESAFSYANPERPKEYMAYFLSKII